MATPPQSTLFENDRPPAGHGAQAAKPASKRRAAAPKAEQPKETPKAATGTAVAVHRPRAAATPARKITNATQMLSFIGEASMNKDVNPEKMRELLAIRKELKNEEAREAFDAAFFKLQIDIATLHITKRGMITIFGKNDPEHKLPPIQTTPYAKYEDLNRIIRPMLHKHGFVLKHANGTAEGGKPLVKTRLVHKSGAIDESEFVGEIDASGSKNNVQGRGSTIQYGKRYNTVSLLDIITEEDDDGQKGAGLPITADQLAEIVEAVEAAQIDKQKFLQHLRVTGLTDLPASRFKEAMDLIAERNRAVAAKKPAAKAARR